MSDQHKPPVAPMDKDTLLRKALQLLAKRDYAAAEIEARLRPRSGSDEDLNWVLARLRDAGYVDDARVAVRKAKALREEALVGRRRAELDLERRKLEASAVHQGLSAAYQDVDEASLALRYLQEKLSRYLQNDALEDARQLQRAYGQLRRAGFRHGDVVRALRQYSRLAEEIDDVAQAADE